MPNMNLKLPQIAPLPSRFDFFARIAEFHDLHHELFRVNFGAIGFIDRYHGTLFRRSASKQNSKEAVEMFEDKTRL